MEVHEFRRQPAVRKGSPKLHILPLKDKVFHAPEDEPVNGKEDLCLVKILRLSTIYELRESDIDKDCLTFQQGLLLETLLEHGECRMAFLSEILWPDPDDLPDGWSSCISSIAYGLGNKLKKRGWVIKKKVRGSWRIERRGR